MISDFIIKKLEGSNYLNPFLINYKIYNIAKYEIIFMFY